MLAGSSPCGNVPALSEINTCRHDEQCKGQRPHLAGGRSHEDDQLLCRQLLDVEGVHAQHPGREAALLGLSRQPLRHILIAGQAPLLI